MSLLQTSSFCSPTSTPWKQSKPIHPPFPANFHTGFHKGTNRKSLFTREMKTFAVTASDGRRTESPETVVVEKPPKLRRFEVFQGSPTPFGATAMNDGVNFAIHSSGAYSAAICLISLSDLQENRVTEQINLDPLLNKTGDVWHAFLRGDFEDMLYGYKFDGKFSPDEGHYYDSSRILLDPYAKAVVSREEYGAMGPEGNCWPQMAGMVPSSDNEFDWEGDLPLNHPQKDLIIYEMHVRGFTKHDSSSTKFPGTYLGVVEKLDHLKILRLHWVFQSSVVESLISWPDPPCVQVLGGSFESIFIWQFDGDCGCRETEGYLKTREVNFRRVLLSIL